MFTILLYALIVVCPSPTLCIGASSIKYIDQGSDKVEVIVSQILDCPVWNEYDENDLKKKESQIMKCLAKVADNDIVLIRSAVDLVFKKHDRDSSVDAQVFLLNWYLFQVPEKSPIEDVLFGGWVGREVSQGKVNRLWPFSYDIQGGLRLTGSFQGYFGNGYRGLDEFDYFQKKFGLRKMPLK